MLELGPRISHYRSDSRFLGDSSPTSAPLVWHRARPMKLLVTGGAGYIGSIVGRQLLAAGHEVVVFDNLERGHRAAVAREMRLVVADLLDADAVAEVLREGFDGGPALRGAGAGGRIGGASRALLPHERRRNAEPARSDAGRRRESTGFLLDVRGLRPARSRSPIPETAPPRPTNAYGASKLAVDHMIGDFCVAYGIGAVSLRYFNVAGASAAAGEDHDPETHLIPNILRAALGINPAVEIYGTDYPTADGTAIRDYIHIDDLSDAHLLALDGTRARRAPDLQPRQRQRVLGTRGDRRRERGHRQGDRDERGAAARRATRRCWSQPARRSAPSSAGSRASRR